MAARITAASDAVAILTGSTRAATGWAESLEAMIDSDPRTRDSIWQGVSLALAALAVTGTIASTTSQAEAKPYGWGWGVGAGLVGAAIVGSAIAASDGYYDTGYRRCGWVRQFDAYGNYIGRVRTCY